MKKRSLLLSSFLFALTSFVPQFVQAAINNPALNETLGGTANNAATAEDGTVFVTYFIVLWRGVIAVGSLLVLVYFMWGAIEWITAAGEAGKITKARDKITQAVIGLIMLISAFAIIGFLSSLFFGPDFNLLNITFPTTGTSAAPGR